jgi:hypothetical protein
MRDEVNEQATVPATAGELVTLDQPGGTISLRDGVPVNPMSVKEAAQSSLVAIGEQLPWLAPLLESVALASNRRDARFINEWGDGKINEDPVKYEAYVKFLRNEIDAQWPWLLGLFDACGALILVMPGSFSFCTSLHLGISFTVPELSNLTYLTPFAADAATTLH